MAHDPIDGSTLGVSKVTGTRSDTGLTVPALTVLFHPCSRRIGDYLLLSELAVGRQVDVSRLAPGFAAVGKQTAEPLADLFLSRQPLRFGEGRQPGSVEIERGGCRTLVRADGEELPARRAWSAEQVTRGALLELADRVVLLLHSVPVPMETSAESFGLVGDSPSVAELRGEIRRVADLDVPVLLRGETGTGKELVAEAIHRFGNRSRRPFVTVNLGALSPTLAAAELFGAVRGAYTGAVRHRDGYFQRAAGGTLFLDEIGEAQPETQVALLRAIDRGEVMPVGGDSPRRIDVRLIAATDADLEQRVLSGDFREPLFHRLAGYEILLPSLRQRRDDLGRLLLHFLRQELTTVGELHRLEIDQAGDEPWLPAKLVARLACYPWPGNVRQLRNVVRQLVIGSRGRRRLRVPARLEQLLADSWIPSTSTQGESGAVDPRPYRNPREVSEQELRDALCASRFDIKASAERLRISRTSLYALIDRSPNLRTARELTPEEIRECHRECGGELEKMVERLEVSKRALRRRMSELGLD